MDEHRWTEAQKEIGRRHPYWTVYGRKAITCAVLTASGAGLWWAAGTWGLTLTLAAVAVTAAGIIAWVLR